MTRVFYKAGAHVRGAGYIPGPSTDAFPDWEETLVLVLLFVLVLVLRAVIHTVAVGIRVKRVDRTGVVVVVVDAVRDAVPIVVVADADLILVLHAALVGARLEVVFILVVEAVAVLVLVTSRRRSPSESALFITVSSAISLVLSTPLRSRSSSPSRMPSRSVLAFMGLVTVIFSCALERPSRSESSGAAFAVPTPPSTRARETQRTVKKFLMSCLRSIVKCIVLPPNSVARLPLALGRGPRLCVPTSR